MIYDYGANAVWAVNEGAQPLAGAVATVRVLDLAAKEVLSTTRTLDVAVDTPAKVLDLPVLPGITPAYFLDLRLAAADGAEIARSFYWLSTKPDVLDPARSEWYVTPNKAFADFTALARLPEAEVALEQRVEGEGEERRVRFTLTNRSPGIAFFIELKLVSEKSGETILPVEWDDNYLSLLPGERRELAAAVRGRAAEGSPVVRLSGWNVRPL